MAYLVSCQNYGQRIFSFSTIAAKTTFYLPGNRYNSLTCEFCYAVSFHTAKDLYSFFHLSFYLRRIVYFVSAGLSQQDLTVSMLVYMMKSLVYTSNYTRATIGFFFWNSAFARPIIDCRLLIAIY